MKSRRKAQTTTTTSPMVSGNNLSHGNLEGGVGSDFPFCSPQNPFRYCSKNTIAMHS
ncbi:MAG: hypothetical protein M3247_06930 [Thermoproteota archaeon]|nr:hypothetical protein [Thermoproteota archaeon]